MTVDSNSPQIAIDIDPQDFIKGLETLDQRFAKTFEHMQQKYEEFKKNAQKTLDDLERGCLGGFSAGQGGSNSEAVASARRVEEIRNRAIRYEEHAIKQRQEQIKTQQDILRSSKDMVLAVGALATGGMGAKALLDFSHNMGRLETFLHSIHAKTVNAFAMRNELRKTGAEDGEIWGVFQGISNTLYELQTNNGGNLPKDQQYALKLLSKYNPNLQIGHRTKALTTDQQAREYAKGMKRYREENPQVDENQVVKTFASLLQNNSIVTEGLLRGNFDFSKADLARAKQEVDTLEKNKEIDREYQKLKMQFEISLAKTMAQNGPEIIACLKALTAFMSNYGQIAMTVGMLASFGSVIGAIAWKIRKLLKLLGIVAESSGGRVLKWGQDAGKWGGKNAWKAGKWVAEHVEEGAKWVAEHPGEVVKTGTKWGGRLVGAVPYVAYDLTIGNITDAQPTAEWDEPIYESNGKLSRTGRKFAIEKALHATIGKSWNGNYYVQTKDWVYVYIDDQFNEPIEKIKRRLQQAKAEKNSSSGGLLRGLIPSAHAEEVVFDSKHSGGSINSNAIKDAYRILTQKDQYGSFSEEQAKGIIANLMGESGRGLNSTAVGDKGKAYGLAQWHSNRQADFEKIFNHPIQQGTFAEQVEFLKWELQHTEKAAGDRIRQAKTAQEATVAAVRFYERPKDKDRQSFERQANITEVNRGLVMKRAAPPSLSHLVQHARQQQIMNSYSRNTKSSTNQTMNNNGTYYINLHGGNATPQGVASEIKRVNTFPSAKDVMGLKGVT